MCLFKSMSVFVCLRGCLGLQLALMTLVRHRQANNRSVEEMLDYDGACVPLKLLNPETVPEMQKLELKAWMVAQILMLVHEFTVPLMMDVRSFPSRRSPYPPPTRIVQLTRCCCLSLASPVAGSAGKDECHVEWAQLLQARNNHSCLLELPVACRL